jgi:hypothetical protein
MTRPRRALKSSLAARRLIRAAVKRHHSQHKAARALGLPSQAQLSKMLRGDIRDTPAMKAALRRAGARAQRAWGLEKGEPAPCVDVALVLESVERLERELAVLKSLISIP